MRTASEDEDTNRGGKVWPVLKQESGNHRRLWKREQESAASDMTIEGYRLVSVRHEWPSVLRCGETVQRAHWLSTYYEQKKVPGTC